MTGLGVFVFYFLLFLIFFVISRRKGEKFNYKITIIIPALLAVVLVLLSVIKIYFIYKILLVLIALVLFALTYWHWGESIREWFR